MSRKSILPYALTALLTLAGGCSKDKTSTEPTGATLTDTEFTSMMDAMDAMGILLPLGAIGAQPATSGGLAAQTTQTVPVDETVSCAGGGSYRVQGSFTENASGSISGNLTETISNCKGTSSDGATFTFNTNPNLTMALTATANQTTGAFSMTFRESGTINWTTSGKSGGCSIDLTVTASVSAQGAVAGSISGTVCGRSANETF